MDTKQLNQKNYNSLYNVLQAYRRAGGKSDTLTGQFNRFDNPGTLYFRIFFDFQKGLLDCIHDVGQIPQLSRDDFWNRNTIIHNSALNYLTINNEWERADMLRDFISLLSNISVNSPWYFMSLEGLGDVLNRQEFTADAFTIGDIKGIGIKCTQDAYDQRIGTLLDLYRAICYSWQLHKEILPANLRRFNMYVYIFPAMKRGIHTLHTPDDENPMGETREPNDNDFASFDQDEMYIDPQTGDVERDTYTYLTSSKLILLKECEIDLNAVVTGYESVNNEEGFSPSYTIPIKVRSAEEQRYNEFLMKRIGDWVVGDMDIPGANEDSQGKAREIVWDAETANQKTTVSDYDGEYQDQRINKYLTTGRRDDNMDNEEAMKKLNEERSKQNDLKTSLKVDRNKPSNGTQIGGSLGGAEDALSPWMDMAGKKADQLLGQVGQIADAGHAAISSWTNINKLSANVASGVDSLINRMLFGNIFETSFQDITTGLANDIGALSSGNVVDKGLRGKGWTHENRNMGSRGDLNQNIFER